MSSPTKSDRLDAASSEFGTPKSSFDRPAKTPSPKPGASKVKGMAARWETKPDTAPTTKAKAQPKRLNARRPTISTAAPRSGSPSMGARQPFPGTAKLDKASPRSTSPPNSFKSVDPKTAKRRSGNRGSGGSLSGKATSSTAMARSGSTGATATASDALAPADADPASKSDAESFVSTMSPSNVEAKLERSPSIKSETLDAPADFDSVPLNEDDVPAPERNASNGDISPIKMSPSVVATSPVVEPIKVPSPDVQLRVEPPEPEPEPDVTHAAREEGTAAAAAPSGTTDDDHLATVASNGDTASPSTLPAPEPSPVKAAFTSLFGRASPSANATSPSIAHVNGNGKGKAAEETAEEGVNGISSPKDAAAKVGSSTTEVSSAESKADKAESIKAESLKVETPKVSTFFASAQKTFGSFSLPSVTLPTVARTAEPPRATETVPEPATNDKASTTPVASCSSSENLTPTDSQQTQSGHQKTGSHSYSAANWRTTMSNTMSNLLRGQANPPPPPSPVRTGSSSAAFILKQIESPTSVRDRRISREAGGNTALREGFERVRNEMEGAARDLRRDRAARGFTPGDEDEVDWTFWGAVVQDYEEVARTRPKELSRAIQQGIPPVIRGPIWQLMSSAKDTELEETYKALLKLTSPHEKAIHKDLARTFPNHQFFQGTGTGQESLFMVVKAYSLYDREVGYTQGLAFVVAALLLHMPDEEAFCVLVRLMDSYNLRSHYLAEMPGLQLRLYQFDRLVEDCLPLLHNHMVRKGIKSSMFASQWFMTLFSYRFPLALVYRVFDIVLAEGTEAMFRFSLALLRRSEEELLKLTEFEDILHYLSGDLFEVYRAKEGEHVTDETEGQPTSAQGEWRTNDFVRDAYDARITPLMLDGYESEWAEKCRAQTAHLREVEALRSANRHLSAQVKSLEASVAAMNTEHVDLVKELVMAKIAREEMETELVKYKAMCAQLAQAQPGDITPPSRRSSDVPPPLPNKQSPRGSPLLSSAMPNIKRVASALSQRSNTSNAD